MSMDRPELGSHVHTHATTRYIVPSVHLPAIPVASPHPSHTSVDVLNPSRHVRVTCTMEPSRISPAFHVGSCLPAPSRVDLRDLTDRRQLKVRAKPRRRVLVVHFFLPGTSTYGCGVVVNPASSSLYRPRNRSLSAVLSPAAT